MKESLRDTGQVLYSRCCVLDAPSDVPDGSYTVFFDGHCVSAVRQDGLWLPEDRAEPLPPEARPDAGQAPPFRTQDPSEILPLLKSDAA